MIAVSRSVSGDAVGAVSSAIKLHEITDSFRFVTVLLHTGELSRLSLVSPKVYFSILSLMEFWFLAVVASGLLSWGHFISSDMTGLIAQILFKLN